MRGIPNRQQISSTARWNYVQSDPASVGAQKQPVINSQTGQGTNIETLKRALASAELALQQTNDPRTIQNIQKGINALKANLIRALGGDHHTLIDLNTITENVTGYEFAGADPSVTGDLNSTFVERDQLDQSTLSPFAAFQLFGTLRQKITKVGLPLSGGTTSPGGFQKYIENPQERSNVIRTLSNPQGSTFQTGMHDFRDFNPTQAGTKHADDTRDTDYQGTLYLQGFTPGTHSLNTYTGRGVVPADQPARGYSGRYNGGYQFNPGDMQ